MATYFYIRAINLDPDRRHPLVHDNTLVGDDQYPGNFLVCYLTNEGAPISLVTERGTAGNVCDPINVDHGERPTVKGSLDSHEQLLKFLNSRINDHSFAELEIREQRPVRDFRALVVKALELQQAMHDIDAPIIFTVSWG